MLYLKFLLTLLQDSIYKVRSVMKGTMTYRNLGNLSMNLEVSLLTILTPPYKYSNPQLVSNTLTTYIWRYCFS